MTSIPDLVATIPVDERVASAVRTLSEQKELLAVAATLPPLMLACRWAAQRPPERPPEEYDRIEAVFREHAKTQALLLDDSPYSPLFAATAPHFKEFSFVENSELIARLPQVGPWLDALNVPQDKRNQLWRFIDWSLPDVVRDLSERRETSLARYFEEDVGYASTPGPEWQHLSPWSFAKFLGDVFVSGSIITGGTVSLILAGTPPVGWVLVVGAGILYLAGESIKNAFEKQKSEQPP